MNIPVLTRPARTRAGLTLGTLLIALTSIVPGVTLAASPVPSSSVQPEGSPSQSAPPGDSAWVDLLPFVGPGERSLVVLDIAALRSGLGLAPDVDPLSDPSTQGSEGRLLSLMSLALPYLRLPGQDIPAKLVLDHGAITAAVSDGLLGPDPEAVTALRTSQPADEIGSRLAASGFEEVAPSIWLLPGASVVRTVYPVVGFAADGTVVLGRDPQVVAAAVGRTEPLQAVLDRAATADRVLGPARSVLALGPGCGEGVAVGEGPEPGAATIAVRVGPEADPANVRLVGPRGEYPGASYADVAIEDGWVTYHATVPGDAGLPLGSASLLLFGDPTREDFYACGA
jgi:hypothetical protein